MDDADRAGPQEDAFRAEALRKARLPERAPIGWDGESCTECGEELAEARLVIGAWICVPCKTHTEKMLKLFRR